MRTTRFIYQRAVYLLALTSLLSFVIFGVAQGMRLRARRGRVPAARVAPRGHQRSLAHPVARPGLVDSRGAPPCPPGDGPFLVHPGAPPPDLDRVDLPRCAGLRRDHRSSVFILAVRAFLVIYSSAFYLLAIRALPSSPDVHARWMICSAMVLIDPPLSRLSTVLHPVPFTTGFHQGVTFAAMDAVILTAHVRAMTRAAHHAARRPRRHLASSTRAPVPLSAYIACC